jgi:hypothetical protein
MPEDIFETGNAVIHSDGHDATSTSYAIDR